MGNYRVSGGVQKGWWEGHFFQVCTGVDPGCGGEVDVSGLGWGLYHFHRGARSWLSQEFTLNCWFSRKKCISRLKKSLPSSHPRRWGRRRIKTNKRMATRVQGHQGEKVRFIGSCSAPLAGSSLTLSLSWVAPGFVPDWLKAKPTELVICMVFFAGYW